MQPRWHRVIERVKQFNVLLCFEPTVFRAFTARFHKKNVLNYYVSRELKETVREEIPSDEDSKTRKRFVLISSKCLIIVNTKLHRQNAHLRTLYASERET